MSVFDYNLLNALWAVIREGSFDGAATRLNITPSAVSQRIKLLESRVGHVLVIRSKPCEATEMGYRLFSHMEQVKLLETDIQPDFHKVGSSSGTAPPVLRVGVSGDSMNTWFNEVVTEFGPSEQVLFHILRDDREYTTEALKRGEVIATVTPTDRLLEGLKSVPLGRLEYSAVVSPEYFKAHFAGGITLDSVSRTYGIAFDEKDSLPALWMDQVLGRDIPIESHRIPSFSGYLQACRAGLGWGIAPSLAVADLIERGDLIELLPGNRISTELAWQYSAISSEVLTRLTRKVQTVARRVLTKAVPDGQTTR